MPLPIFLLFLFVFIFIHCSVIAHPPIEQLLKQLDPPLLSHDHRETYFTHPQCMHHWINVTYPWQKIQELKTSFLPAESFFHSSSKESCSSLTNRENTVIILTGNTGAMEFIGHFPHFSTIFFRFYSILLWQRQVYPETNQDYCLHHIVVNDSNSLFWQTISSDSYWTHALLKKMNHYFGANMLMSNTHSSQFNLTGKKILPIILSLWPFPDFVHPADSLLLTHTLLGTDPCSYRDQGKKILKEKLNVFVINRESNRGMANIQEIMNLLHLQNETLGLSFNIVSKDLSYHSFQQQVEIMSKVDIVISIHGAALANVAFMKPCSVVIVICPWIFQGYGYFIPLAKAAGLEYYEWMEPRNHTTYKEHGSSASCQAIFDDYDRKYPAVYEGEGLYFPDHLQSKCYADAECFRCAFNINNVVINTPKLLSVFQKGLKDREQCIKHHPFYNSD